MSLQYFAEYGWTADVLTVKADHIRGNQDPLLAQTLPRDLKVFSAGAFPAGISRLFGVGSVALRAFWHLWRLGNRLLSQQRYSLVFFSTTLFPVLALGPLWRKRHGVPYVLDLQDPWVNDYYKRSGVRPPGGPLKFGLSQLIAHVLEPEAVRQASAIVCVSPEYPRTLSSRYPWLRETVCSVLPFGGAEKDFAVLDEHAVRQQIFDGGDGQIHWVYAGRGGADMAYAARALFRAFRRARETEPERFGKVRMHFIGTDYAPGSSGRKTIAPLALEEGVADAVEEITERVPYFQVLRCLRDADALLVIGSNDPGYSASKIYPYVLAAKPLLVIVHEESGVVDMLSSTRAGTLVTFRGPEGEDVTAAAIGSQWFEHYGEGRAVADWPAFERYSARAMTQTLCARFDEVLHEQRRR